MTSRCAGPTTASRWRRCSNYADRGDGGAKPVYRDPVERMTEAEAARWTRAYLPWARDWEWGIPGVSGMLWGWSAAPAGMAREPLTRA